VVEENNFQIRTEFDFIITHHQSTEFHTQDFKHNCDFADEQLPNVSVPTLDT
jgi:hypothetical protein